MSGDIYLIGLRTLYTAAQMCVLVEWEGTILPCHAVPCHAMPCHTIMYMHPLFEKLCAQVSTYVTWKNKECELTYTCARTHTCTESTQSCTHA